MRENIDGRARVAILALFFLSGACSLVYELVWLRMFVVVFGTSMFAVATVLSAFMAGLALGSAWFGRVADRGVHGLKTFALLEAGIGLIALAFPFVLSRLDDLYTVLYQHWGGSTPTFALVRFAFAFLVLLPPTTLMGASLPVLTRYIVRSPARVGGTLGRLYAVNTLGAATGCLAAAYGLMNQVGTSGTTYIAAAVNLLIAGVALALSRAPGSRRISGAGPSPEPPVLPVEPTASPRLARMVFLAFALSGFCALGYEVIWTRLLCIVLHITTVQSVSTILIAFLGGLAVGGAVGARLADRWSHPAAAFGVVLLLLGLCSLGSITLLGWAQDALAALPAPASWSSHLFRLLGAASWVMFAPTFLMGLLLPLAGKICARRGATLGSRIGDIYAANTGGAIAGAFVTGFVLIPRFGTQHAILVLAIAQIAVGAAVLLASPAPRRSARLAVVAGGVLGILALGLLVPSNSMQELLRKSQPGAALLFYAEGTGGTVTVHEFDDGHRMMRVNGAGEVPTDRASLRTFRLLGNLPFLIHPSPDDVLVIAFGGGVTLAEVERHAPRRIDCVETVGEVIEGARLFDRFNNRVFDRIDGERLQVIVDDGRNHVLRSERSYDVIISDSTHPSTADSWVLYTEEFYRLGRQRLKDGGVFAQWLPLHGLSVEHYKMILRTFSQEFPHGSLWMTRNYTILLGTQQRLRIDLRQVEARLRREGVRESLDEVDLADPLALAATLVLEESGLAEYAGSGRVNTDDRPYLSFDDRAKGGTAGGLAVLLDLLPYLPARGEDYLVDAGEDDRRALREHLMAAAHRLRGDAALKLGDRASALREFRQAHALDPNDRVAGGFVRRLERETTRRGSD